jgi:lysyl-tRNA synthetase class I
MVRIFDTHEAMHKYYNQVYKKWGMKKSESDFDGIVIPYSIMNSETGEITDQIGNILLKASHIGAEYISHEICHAAFWVERFKHNNTIFDNMEIEERFCYTQCYLMRAIVDEIYKEGYYEIVDGKIKKGEKLKAIDGSGK